jgi:phosphoribosylformylglycinamidine cyclo-ligase
LTDIGGTFSGFRGIHIGQFPDIYNLIMNIGFDGVGTKIEIAERIQDFSTIAFDLFAMVCDDAAVRGAETIGIGSVLDVRQLENTEEMLQAMRQLAKGYVDAAKAANVVVLNGELAELGNRVGGHGSFNCNWGATALYLVHKSRILTGDRIKAGDAIIGLAEFGFRSNGLTDVRKAMLEKYGANWHDVFLSDLDEAKRLGELVATPSIIYSPFITALTGGYDINRPPLAKISGVAHITGGGQPSKIGRLLQQTDGLGAMINNPIQPPKIMQFVQRLRKFDDHTSYGKWNMGLGMVVTTSEPDKVLALAKEHGITAQQIGEITDKGTITIRSCGISDPGRYLDFDIKN